MDTKPKIIYVDWRQWESGQTFLTDQKTQVRVARAAIPIIFVPGIMGTRLKKIGGSRCWDPDDLPFMLHNFFRATGADRQKLLTADPAEVDQRDAGGAPTFNFHDRMLMKFTYANEAVSMAMPPTWDWLGLSPDLSADEKLSKTISILIEHGWDELTWSFYGDILLKLAEGDFSELRRCFIHPVYAFGYNWVDDNLKGGAKLADRIRQIVKQENFANHPCDKVILISHSMGGLVTRSCVKHDADAYSKVLGIIHGAQPATGAPAAYRRMRAGFESPHTFFGTLPAMLTNRVLGIDNAQVVPILANCVGGLELLPTTSYKTNTGDKQWLSLSDKNKTVVAKLPHENPYTDIYFSESTAEHKLNNNDAFLQLVLHPSMLSGASGGGTTLNKYAKPDTKLLTGYQAKLKTAQDFHVGLGLDVHQNTYITYVGPKGLRTYDKVHFSYMREQDETRMLFTRAGAVTYKAPPENEGEGIDLDTQPPGGGGAEYFEIDAQNGTGDGTVPVSSSKALIDANKNVQTNNAAVRDDKGKLVTAVVESVEHGQFFNDAGAVNFTRMAIRQLDWKYRFEKLKR